MTNADVTIVSSVINAIRSKEIDVTQVLGVVTYTMTLVEKLKSKMPGSEKAAFYIIKRHNFYHF